jgi:hypothetical protein
MQLYSFGSFFINNEEDSCHPINRSIIVEHVYTAWLEGIRSLRVSVNKANLMHIILKVN